MCIRDRSKTAGGKGLNVTRVLSEIKDPVAATGLLGGRTGQFILDHLGEEMCIRDRRITDRIRQIRGGLVIINGESLGQVASQTLESMQAINAVTNTPIIRPVVTMDKLEIIDIAQEIDTFETVSYTHLDVYKRQILG